MSTQLSAELSRNDPIRKLSTNILPYYDVVSLVQFFFFLFLICCALIHMHNNETELTKIKFEPRINNIEQY